MAYCLKCGAYIPDGQIMCLACGYDPEAEKKAAAAAQQQSTDNKAYQYSGESNEELRKRLEEQRKRTQEQNRQWAEQEKARREEQAAREKARREQQEQDRRWAQEEYRRRQAEKREQTAYDADRGYESGHSSRSAGEGNKALAALSYLSILFTLPYIFAPQDEFAKYHAKQGIKLFIIGILADIAAAMIGFGWIVTIARLYLMYKGMSNALNGKKEPLPLIGTIGEK